jgi:hypothetical protein
VAPGTVLTAPSGQTKVLVGSPTGTGSLQAVDDAGPDFNYALNEVCEATGRPGSNGGLQSVRRTTSGSRSPSLATTGMNAALPIVALVFLGFLGVVVWLRRRPEDGA